MEEIKQPKPTGLGETSHLDSSKKTGGEFSDFMSKFAKKYGGINLSGTKSFRKSVPIQEGQPDTLKETKKSGISMEAPEYDSKSLSEQGRKFLDNPEENFDEVGLIHDVPGMIDTYHKYGLDSNKFINKMSDNKIARLAVEDMFPSIFEPLYEEKMLVDGKIPQDTYNYALRKAFKEVYSNPKKAQELQEKMRFKAADEKAKLAELLKAKGSK